MLVLGFGNPARRDDGLGPAVVTELEKRRIPGLVTISEYQLAVEHARDAADHDAIIFADSHPQCREPFELHPVAPSDSEPQTCFTSHVLTPEQIVKLTADLFNRRPRSYLLAIKGYSFEPFEECLTPRAKANMLKAADFIAEKIRRGEV